MRNVSTTECKADSGIEQRYHTSKSIRTYKHYQPSLLDTQRVPILSCAYRRQAAFGASLKVTVWHLARSTHSC
jgi:hypothetical protein